MRANKKAIICTTNVDHCFQKAGFNKNRLFYTQGDYGLFQSTEPGDPVTYENVKGCMQKYEIESDSDELAYRLRKIKKSMVI